MLNPSRVAERLNSTRFVEENGYPLSDIEQVILGKRKADSVYRQTCKED